MYSGIIYNNKNIYFSCLTLKFHFSNISLFYNNISTSKFGYKNLYILHYIFDGVTISSKRDLIEETRTQVIKASRVNGYL